MKKKITLKNLIWGVYSLILAALIHFFAPGYLFIQFWKYIFILSFVLNICSVFNIKIPYITDKKKLPKNYNIYAFVITLIIYLCYLIYFEK